MKHLFLFHVGLTTKGYKACPPCGDSLYSKYSKNLKKNIYLGHRRYLPPGHILRSKVQARNFNGKVENGQCPQRMNPMDWYRKWTTGSLIEAELTSNINEDDDCHNAGNITSMSTSISIWYTLEYWKNLKITHLLDPMHIFKNVAHSLWKHLVGLKDIEAAREDLKHQNYKPTLWPISDDQTKKVTYVPAPWVLTKQE